jgi:alpha-L-arabinofuranosidase
MYSLNKGHNVLPLLMNKKVVAGDPDQDGLFASAVVDNKTNEVIVKVVNTSRQSQPITLNLKGMKGNHTVKTITLTSNDMDAENSLDNPTRIVPIDGTASADGDKMTVLTDNVPAMTFRIYKVKK